MNYIAALRRLISYFINTRKFFKKRDSGDGNASAATAGGETSDEDDGLDENGEKPAKGSSDRFRKSVLDGLVMEQWYALFVQVYLHVPTHAKMLQLARILSHSGRHEGALDILQQAYSSSIFSYNIQRKRCTRMHQLCKCIAGN